MFYLSSKIANWARIERYYISSFKYKTIYTFACIVRVLELSAVMGFVYLSVVIILSI